MLPCPVCEMPFEHGETQCIRCRAPLAADWHLESALRRSANRRRAGRIVRIATPVIYLACILGLTAVQAVLIDDLTRTRWRHLGFVAPFVVLIWAWLALYGYPGRTLNHYPSQTIIRDGRPRWWKGALASAIFIISAAVAMELIARPALDSSIVRLMERTPQEAAAGIDAWALAFYVTVGIMLLWMLVAPLFGPQEMGKRRRWHQMEAQN